MSSAIAQSAWPSLATSRNAASSRIANAAQCWGLHLSVTGPIRSKIPVKYVHDRDNGNTDGTPVQFVRQQRHILAELDASRDGTIRIKHPRRALVDAILYVVRTGCAWRHLPADFPPWQTMYWYFNRWEQYKVTGSPKAVTRGPEQG